MTHPKTDLLERIQVQKPCDADWDAMSGNERVRFCEHCRLSVKDLSRMTRREALALVAASNGRLCVRYVRLPDGTVKTADAPPPPQQLYTIARRASRFAAGAFSAALGLGATVAAQTQTQTPAARPAANRPEATSTAARPAPEVRSDDAQQPVAQAPVTTTLELPKGREFVTMGVMLIVREPVEPLVKAAFKNDAAGVEKLLSGGLDANVLDRAIDSTALSQAVAHNNLRMVKALLDAGAEVNAENREGRTALMMLDAESPADLARALLDAGADVNVRDDNGNAALAHASMGGSAEVIRMLLDARAKVNAGNDVGRTALMLAAEAGELENVRALVAAGADYNLKDDEGATALDLARAGEHDEVVALLVAHGAVEGEKREKSEEDGDEDGGDEEP